MAVGGTGDISGEMDLLFWQSLFASGRDVLVLATLTAVSYKGSN